MRLPRNSVSHLGSSVAARKICGVGKRCQGVTGQHGCLFSFDPGVYDRMQLPYIRCLPLMVWHEEKQNKKQRLDLSSESYSAQERSGKESCIREGQSFQSGSDNTRAKLIAWNAGELSGAHDRCCLAACQF